ncbi:MAG: DUF1015 domain-containing protein [Clostridia bacterium]|nr:DUF1015 domain-containing protein [Clostridia bacterium]
MKNNVFFEADILLPDFQKADGTRYAVIACDQFTSEPAYWEAADALVGDAPSTLRMILPECYLDERAARVPAINAAMDALVADGFFVTHRDSILHLERTCPDGRVRHGLIGKVDLECYGFLPEDTKMIRATEGTVLERIPPRVEIRRDAALELPHVMLLIDDPKNTVFSLLGKKDTAPIYDFPLMAGGGHVRGTLLTAEEKAAVDDALTALISTAGGAPLLFAVGDGNHSLATAKTCYEELKKTIGKEAALVHPARYALVEVVNLHDTALDFEPIYRVVMGADAEDLLAALSAYTEKEADPALGTAEFTVITAGCERTLTLGATHVQPVGTLQKFLDQYLATHPEMEVDYIHDEDSLRALAAEGNNIGFLFRGMKKEDLFPAILAGGPLPRKTFSMGHARDKRYYLEARRIRA